MALAEGSDEQLLVMSEAESTSGSEGVQPHTQRRWRSTATWAGLLAILAVAGAGGVVLRRTLRDRHESVGSRNKFLAEFETVPEAVNLLAPAAPEAVVAPVVSEAVDAAPPSTAAPPPAVASPPGLDPVVSQAKELTSEADRLKGEIQAQKDEAEKMGNKSEEQLKAGKHAVKEAGQEYASAKTNETKALEMEREAKLNLEQAEAMLAASKKNAEAAQEQNATGLDQISTAKSLSASIPTVEKQAQDISEQALAVERKEVGALQKEAKYLKERSDKDTEDASADQKAAGKKLKAAEAKLDEAGAVLDAARKNISKADKIEAAAAADVESSQAIQDESAQQEQAAASDKESATQELADGKAAAEKAKVALANVDKEQGMITKLEKKSAKASHSHRMCVDLPGVRLATVGAERAFDPLSMEKDVDSAAECTTWCRDHEECVQSRFSTYDSRCRLFEEATATVAEWRHVFNTSVCGDKQVKEQLVSLVDKVYAQQPTIPEVVECAWAGDDCSESKCCNDAACSWDFKTCKPHSCYQDAKGNAQCKESSSWSTGTIVGGGRDSKPISKSGKGVTVQGTSLFCFMVVHWKSDEGAIANNIKEKKLGVYQCDEHQILTGWQTDKTPWSTLMNAGAFVKLWQQLQEAKLYEKHDWTVKVDADAVFFPIVLKSHLAALRTPQGASVYVQNINYKFKFQGALEVMTRDAVAQYFAHSADCSTKLLKAFPKAGEDFYMKMCLDASGVSTQEDFELLRDSTCGDDCPDSDGPCSNGWTAAYHAYRTVDDWNTCYEEATAAQKKAGIAAPEAPPAAQAEELPSVHSDAADDAESLMGEAKTLAAKVQPDADEAHDLDHSAKKSIAHAHTMLKHSAEQDADARKNASHAKELRKKAEKKDSAAQDLEESSEKTKAEAEAKQAKWQGLDDAAQAAADGAQEAMDAAEQEHRDAAEAESHMLSEVALQRLCVDLPGVHLQAGTPVDLPAIVEKPDLSDATKCREWCREHDACKMAIFSAEDQRCEPYQDAADMPIAFVETYNSSYCGSWDEKATMMGMLKKVFKMNPYVPPVRPCSWAGEDCSQTRCCANVPVPNWKFTKFEWYTCYRRDPTFASCKLGPAPENWDGERLGGMGTREVPKAADEILKQGTSLFCFAVVMWSSPPTKAFWSSEADLANNIRNTSRSIFQCEEHAFFDGSGLNAGGDGSSINNIDSFIGAWQKVRDDGRYLQHDWTVKVDADAVFFPDRLKKHLWDLRTPQGSRVYLKNIDFKFHFLGALEVFTKEALQLFFDKQDVCAGKVGHQGGEDYYMEACLDGIGVDHQTDFKLLNDKYAATGNCNDPWVVAFHFYKKVVSWNACYDAARNAEKAADMSFKQ